MRGPTIIIPSLAEAPIIADATIIASPVDQVEATQYPVQSGGMISDHARKLPVELSMDCIFGAKSDESIEIYRRLIAIMNRLDPIEIITMDQEYRSMLLTSVEPDYGDRSVSYCRLRISAREIRRVDVTRSKERVKIKVSSDGSKQADGKTTGPTEKKGNVQTVEDDRTYLRRAGDFILGKTDEL